MKDYELKVKENDKRNEKFLSIFESWLNSQKLSEKTINKHMLNVILYINNFLNYYDAIKMEEGIREVYSFLNDWFIRKCLWASDSSINEMATSIKKFYKCMSENGYVKPEDYKVLCRIIKENMDVFLDSLNEFENYDYEKEEWEEFI